MRKVRFAPGEYYHLYNRGNNKQHIFFEEKDWIRFLFLILFFQAPVNFFNISRAVNFFVRSRASNMDGKLEEKIHKNRYIDLVNFTLMPNHFHLCVREVKESGISRYMQRVLTAYPKYINAKQGKSGHLFQGPYQAKLISSNEQLLYLSTYIHKNPHELNKWRGKEHFYPWSSYQDYVGENRWGKLLQRDVILGQFSNPDEYTKFVKDSPAKDNFEEILFEENV